MSAKHPSLFFKTKEQLFSAKDDYERMGFKVQHNLDTLTLTIYQDNSKSKKHRQREAKLSSRREHDDEQYTDKYA